MWFRKKRMVSFNNSARIEYLKPPIKEMHWKVYHLALPVHLRKGLIVPCSGLRVFWTLLRGSFLVHPQVFLVKTLFTIFWENSPFSGVKLLFLLHTLKIQLSNAVSCWIMDLSKVKRLYFNRKRHFGKTQNCLEGVDGYVYALQNRPYALW